MTTISCYLAELKVPHDTPLGNKLEVGGLTVTEYFQKASRLANGSAAIDFSLDVSRRHNLVPKAGTGVDDWQLQDALMQLLTPNHSAVPAVGLILADVYTPLGDVYGFMFDLDSHMPTYGPRQGCVVFIDKIKAVIEYANKGDLDFRELVAYTAVHELGHIFNLWHVDDPPSFMTQYPSDNFLNACCFVPKEMEFLRYAVDPQNAKYVLPGGSAFGDRGTIGDSSGDNSYLLPKSTVLKLEIGMSQQEFWQFEPIELDIKLSVIDPKLGPIMVPDEIDPGYARFEIWITQPNQERQRYRSLKRFCGTQEPRELRPNVPFQRDISIFRQSGGYTFGAAGKYKIQAMFHLPEGEIVVSNIIECEVIGSDNGAISYDDMRTVLSEWETINFLRYKSRLPHRTAYVRLNQFIDTHYETPTAAAIHYCIGQAMRHMSYNESDTKIATRLHEQGTRYLEKVANHSQLSHYRKAIVKRLLDEPTINPQS